MKIGDKIDHTNFETAHRPFADMQGFVNHVARTMKVMSWGAHAWTRMNEFCLRFMVQGHHHKGHVYLVVNGADLFDAYLTTSKGTIKDIEKDIYLEDLLTILDKKIEYIPEYKR